MRMPIALDDLRSNGCGLKAKLRAQGAVLTGLPETLRRRRRVQATSRLTAVDFATHLTASIDSPFLPVHNAGPAARLLSIYWAFSRCALGVRVG